MTVAVMMAMAGMLVGHTSRSEYQTRRVDQHGARLHADHRAPRILATQASSPINCAAPASGTD